MEEEKEVEEVEEEEEEGEEETETKVYGSKCSREARDTISPFAIRPHTAAFPLDRSSSSNGALKSC